MELASKKCKPCEGGTLPLDLEESRRLLTQIRGWKLENKAIQKSFKFKDFAEAMRFVNRVAGLAEEEGHHPDIHISYNRVKLDLTTHAIGGLSENDFIMAAKIDRL
jgi:4a-hydroxytetrahydrobiopterin dehydratase